MYFYIMKVVTIVPKSKRAKARVKQHGERMLLKRRGVFRGENAMLVESLDGTSFGGHKWHGWFTEKKANVKGESK